MRAPPYDPSIVEPPKRCPERRAATIALRCELGNSLIAALTVATDFGVQSWPELIDRVVGNAAGECKRSDRE
jgi:hypothetical protein